MRTTPFKGNIIVWNLPDALTSPELASLFDGYGLVIGATIKRWEDEPGRTARGLVDLAPERAVDRAIEALDGTVVGGRKLKVRRAREAVRPEGAPAPHPAAAARPLDMAAPRAVEVLASAETASMPRPPMVRKAPIVEYRSLPRRTYIARKV